MTKKIDVAQMQADLGNFSSEYETIRHDDLIQVLSRLEQAEQAVQRVREVAHDIRENPENYNPNEYRYPESIYTNWGYRGGASAILRALDGDTRRLADDALGGDQDG